MKKRWFKILVLIACVICLAGCSMQKAPDPNVVELTQEQEQQWYDNASQFILAMNDAVQSGTSQVQAEDPVYGPAFSAWENALPDIGEIQDIGGKSCAFTKKDGVVTVVVKGSRHDADVVFTLEQKDNSYSVTNIATNVDYSMTEKLQQAGLNTLLGMGTTFFILIVLALVIALFGRIVGGFMNRTREQVVVRPDKAKHVPAGPAPVKEESAASGEELANDLVLAAVIAAAIAAYEGKGSTDGFVVRSIRKSRKR